MNEIKTESNYSGIFLVVGMATILATLLIPLPTAILDMLLACSISMSLAVLIVTLSSKEALELSTFPSLLLFATLLRLSLNVASTRLILLNGNAGNVIQTFGSLVAGNSFVVGLVIFLILVVVQFVVITKGAERISEVSARFTLDAMPGKQMAIDADLNAGAVTEKEANERRAKIVKESEFYGAMDGASKFIRGDAKAGLMITAVNIVGGIAMGYSHGMTVGNAVKTYSILSIGDGLVSQVPSLIISISSGILVTKISSTSNVGQDLSKQFLRTGRPWVMTSVLVASLAFVPGLPMLPFLLLGTGAFLVGRAVDREEIIAGGKDQEPSERAKVEKEPVENLLDVDRISVNVGVRLIGLFDPHKNSSVFDRIGALRRRFAQELGFVVPLVRVRDNITLELTAYEIRLSDVPIATGNIEPDMFLAMDPGGVQNKVTGKDTTEPVFGLPALWITPDKKEAAELNGYTVIDPESVFITHLSETLKKNADELLTREDVQLLLDRLRTFQPALVGEVVGELVPIGTLHRVLKNLLRDQVPIRELTGILESLAEHISKTRNTTILTELVRKALCRTITQQYKDENGKVLAIILDPSLENKMVSAIEQQTDEITLSLPTEVTMDISRQIAQIWRTTMDQGKDKVILLCDSKLRAPLASMLARTIPLLPVIAYDEIVLGTEIEPVETISAQASQVTAVAERELIGSVE